MPDPDEPAEYHERPWRKRRRIIPRRTYSGEVIYKRPKHYFTEADITRVMKKLQTPASVDESWLAKILEQILDWLKKILAAIGPLLNEVLIDDLFYWLKQVSEYFMNACINAGFNIELRARDLILWLSRFINGTVTIK